MLLDNETFDRYKYRASEIYEKSHKNIVYLCPNCKEIKETQRRYYTDDHICSSCSGKQSAQKYSHLGAGKGKHALISHWDSCREKGVHPNGMLLFPEDERIQRTRERKRKTSRDHMRRVRSTFLGKITNRLKVSLRHYLGSKKGDTALPYTPLELQKHILAKLEQYDFQCPMCGATLKDKFDIDHRVPLSTGKTYDEIIALFALSNLDVLCPPCNQRVKGAKLIDY